MTDTTTAPDADLLAATIAALKAAAEAAGIASSTFANVDTFWRPLAEAAIATVREGGESR